MHHHKCISLHPGNSLLLAVKKFLEFETCIDWRRTALSLRCHGFHTHRALDIKLGSEYLGSQRGRPKCCRRSNINVLCTYILTQNVVHCFSWQLLKMLTEDRVTEQQNYAAFSLGFLCTVLNCESFLCLSLLIRLTGC